MSGGEPLAFRRLFVARSIHAEAQARFRKCPWSEANLRDLDRAERALETALDAYIDAHGGEADSPSAHVTHH